MQQQQKMHFDDVTKQIIYAKALHHILTTHALIIIIFIIASSYDGNGLNN